MKLFLWFRTQLENHSVGITILSILGSIFSIVGISMNSLLASLFNISSNTLLVAIAIFNTIITLVVISWGKVTNKELEEIKSKIKERKDLLIKAKDKLIFANSLTNVIAGTSTFVDGKVGIKWNQEAPLSGVSKDQAEAIGYYKKAISDFDEIVNQI